MAAPMRGQVAPAKPDNSMMPNLHGRFFDKQRRMSQILDMFVEGDYWFCRFNQNREYRSVR